MSIRIIPITLWVHAPLTLNTVRIGDQIVEPILITKRWVLAKTRPARLGRK